MTERRTKARMLLLVAVVAAIVVLTVLFSHGIRVRFIWGASGFAAGIVFGVLVTLDVQHRWRRRKG